MGIGDPFGYLAASAVAATVDRLAAKRASNAVGLARSAATLNPAQVRERSALATMPASDGGQYVKLTRTRRRLGRKLKKSSKLLKMVNASCQVVVQRFQKLSSWDANMSPASTPLNFVQATADGQASSYPLYVFDMTSVANKVTIGNNSVTYPNVLYRLFRNRAATTTDLTNFYYFNPTGCNGLDQTGNNQVYTWLNERTPRANVFPMSAINYDWFDIRLMLYGAKNIPSRVTVSLVQFDPDFCPNYWTHTSSDATLGVPVGDEIAPFVGNEERARSWNEFWAGRVDRLVSHPMNKRDAYNMKGIRVLHSETHNFNPIASTETDTRGHMKQVKLFQRVNRVMRLQWQRQAEFSAAGTGGAGGGVPASDEADPNRWDAVNPIPATSNANTGNTDNQVAPAPRARIFLMIEASSPNAAFDPLQHCSFDFLIRRKHTIVGNT